MWNLKKKKDTNELIYKTEKDSYRKQTWLTKAIAVKGQGGR